MRVLEVDRAHGLGAGEMKVLVLSSLYPNNIWTHHGVFVKEQMTHFSKLEYCEVTVIAPVPYFPPIKINSRWLYSQVLRKERIEGLEVHHPRYFIIPKVSLALQGLMMFLALYPCIRRIQKEFNFDLIDSHYVYPDGFAAILLGHALGKPVVVSALGTDINRYSQFWLIRKLLRQTLKRADGVIAVSRALKEVMIRMEIPAEKISVVPNGVDVEKFYPIPRPEARSRLNLPDKRILLSVGGLVSGKGFDLLVKALRLLVERQRQQDLYLVIAGEGYFRKDLEKLISDFCLEKYVRLVGDVAHNDLLAYYSAADLFCLASAQEGWPNVIMESLACGTPVVATAVGGIPEILSSDELGIVVRRDEAELAQAIAQALERPWCRQTIVQYAKRNTWHQVAKSKHAVFESLLRRGINNRSHQGAELHGPVKTR
jgi:teichuronic acid biosynthesis glycosyltransferase TuaC